ncbi:MAG: NADH-quinone oxidoreductase subunit C [Candidatus Micrarchaeota archaeon]|nr:NADH-quinone oxidoreductase subunit C [Candidatus Micrarchaeota archaeon]
MKTCTNLKSRGYDYLKKITAVDYVDHLEAVYIIYNTLGKKEEVLRVKLDAEKPKVETVIGVYPAADWYEREMSEMFGIEILKRKSKRLLLEEWNGAIAPFRKSYTWGTDYKKLE